MSDLLACFPISSDFWDVLIFIFILRNKYPPIINPKYRNKFCNKLCLPNKGVGLII